VATATIKKWARSSSWAEIEYVTHPESQRLHLAPKFHQKDCVPETFVQKRKPYWHCGWAVYRKGAADIGEDWQELFAAAIPMAKAAMAMAASEHALTAAMAASAKRASEKAATAASAS
jgi:hypothetical protein